MSENFAENDVYALKDGSKIAVVGGGPAGSFFSIFALKMAKMIGKELNVTIFEQRDFTKEGPEGCDRCGGVISELLVQTLAVEGINLPDKVVQRGINSYSLHTENGNVSIETPSHEKTIATVYRGGGPRGVRIKDKESFDNFLLGLAIKEGAVCQRMRVDKIKQHNGKPVLYSQGNEVQDADLVVGAFGVNSHTDNIFEDMKFGYKTPATTMTSIVEIGLDNDVVSKYFGNSIHLFLLPTQNIKFAAMIPKESYITVCILGKNINNNLVNDFFKHEVVEGVLPDGFAMSCRCLPKMNIKAPEKPFADRAVVCGDAGSTRLFKDGIGAAYIMGKTAAKTAVFEGVSREHFKKYYYPVYKDIVVDNYFGRFLFLVTDIYRKNRVLCKGMLEVVKKEQQEPAEQRILSSMLWDIFTGNERYKNIFFRSLSLKMNLRQLREFIKISIRG